MKKGYEAPKAEKIEFNYDEAVSASDVVVCGSGLKEVYKDMGKLNCKDTFIGTEEVWKADNL